MRVLQDLILGFLLGNCLAVLTWRFLVTPIAMTKRMTLYYQLERIAGGSLGQILQCGQRLAVLFSRRSDGHGLGQSPWACRLASSIEVPEATFGFSAPSFTGLVVMVGVVMAVVAAAGYEMVARVANIAAPWMIAVFAACGIVSLGQMDATSCQRF